MLFIFDFFGSQTGIELLRIVDSLFTIVAAILSGKALQNTYQVKKAIGGVVKPGLFRRFFGQRRHQTDAPADLKLDAFQSLTLAEKVDNLKDNQEILSLRLGVSDERTTKRLDRVDPPNRRH